MCKTKHSTKAICVAPERSSKQERSRMPKQAQSRLPLLITVRSDQFLLIAILSTVGLGLLLGHSLVIFWVLNKGVFKWICLRIIHLKVYIIQ